MHQTATMVTPRPPTLLRLSAIAISKQLWITSLNDHLKSCIEDMMKNIRETEPMRSAAEMIINNFCVPLPAKQELEFVIGSMAYEMLSWFDGDESKRYYLFPRKGKVYVGDVRTCADHFHWTVFGSVDEPKTMRSLYYARMLTDSVSTWKELALDCVEDCLNDLQPKLSNIEKFINRFQMYHLEDHEDRALILMTYWMARAKDDMERVMIDAFDKFLSPEFYDETYSIEGNMFMIIVAASAYKGVTFFWGLMNETEKKRALVKSCEQLIASDRWGPNADLIVFILQKLVHYGLEDIRTRIMRSNLCLPWSLLRWPHDHLFIETLVESSNNHDITDFKYVMSNLIFGICRCSRHHLFDHDVKYHEYFYTIWEMNLGNFKGYIENQYLEMLWRAKELKLLNYILRDPELKDRRKYYLERLVKAFEGEVVDPVFLKKFVAQVLRPDEEWFAKSFPSIQDIEESVDVSKLGVELSNRLHM